jgi:hypothetical protein
LESYYRDGGKRIGNGKLECMNKEAAVGDWKNCRCDNPDHYCFVHHKWGGDENYSEPPSDHPHDEIFNMYNGIKKQIGELGYNVFIHSKEVEEYRAWLRNDKYKHRIDWFEKEYPNGLYYKDEDGQEVGIRIMTKRFLAEADAAYESKPLTEEEIEKAAIELADTVLKMVPFVDELTRAKYHNYIVIGYTHGYKIALKEWHKQKYPEQYNEDGTVKF